jgi:hypothetical protein
VIVFNVLIIGMTLVCEFLVTLWRELGQPIFVEGTFGLTHRVAFVTIVQNWGRITGLHAKHIKIFNFIGVNQ